MTDTSHPHAYRTSLRWTGSTRDGYRNYLRAHRAVAPPAAEITLSADPAFRGDPQYMNPEQLLVMAASSCLSGAARRGVEVLDYQDAAFGQMPHTGEPMRLTVIQLKPVITVADGTVHELVEELVREAHLGCYIANTLNADVVVEPTVVTA